MAGVFLGHFAVGFAAKRAVPRVSLAVLFIAAQLADLVWPVLVATGIEVVRIDPGNTAFTPFAFVSYPYSHSLVMLTLWGLLLGWGYRLLTNRNGHTVAVLAALVVSHWVLDVVVHRPDMPFFPGGGPKVGLGLWNSVPLTLVVELALFLVGLWIYSTTTRPKDAQGRWGWLGLVAILLLAYAGAAFGPPPQSISALSTMAMLGAVIIIGGAWWVDRHRETPAGLATPSART